MNKKEAKRWASELKDKLESFLATAGPEMFPDDTPEEDGMTFSINHFANSKYCIMNGEIVLVGSVSIRIGLPPFPAEIAEAAAEESGTR